LNRSSVQIKCGGRTSKNDFYQLKGRGKRKEKIKNKERIKEKKKNEKAKEKY